MLFAQHNHRTWNKLGKDWLNIHDTPHYYHLLGRDDYFNYLKLSWKGKQEKIHLKVMEFDALVKDIKSNGIKKPIDIVKRFNGDTMIFHGNHRYAIARYLGLEFEAKEIPIQDFINFNILNLGLRFGVNDNGIPYQSVFYKNELIVKGRRQDQLQRHAMIDPDDLKGKRVYDYGCNLGASSILAHESGAAVEGWDLPQFRTVAIRMALMMNYNIQYRLPRGEYDTLFLFSVHAHAGVPDIKAKVIYLETHEDDVMPKYFKKFTKKKVGKIGKRSLYRICT